MSRTYFNFATRKDQNTGEVAASMLVVGALFFLIQL